MAVGRGDRRALGDQPGHGLQVDRPEADARAQARAAVEVQGVAD